MCFVRVGVARAVCSPVPEEVHGGRLAAVDAIGAVVGRGHDEAVERPGLEALVVVVPEAADAVLRQHELRT